MVKKTGFLPKKTVLFQKNIKKLFSKKHLPTLGTVQPFYFHRSFLRGRASTHRGQALLGSPSHSMWSMPQEQMLRHPG